MEPRATLVLFGFEPTEAVVRVVPRTTSWRVSRVARVLGITAVGVPLAFLVPPHAPWAVGALGAGVVLATRRWRERYTLLHVAADCPRCGAAVQMEGVQRLRHPHVLPCDACHHESVLVVDLD